MAKPPPDPIHLLSNPTGAVISISGLNIDILNEYGIISGSENGMLSIWSLNVKISNLKCNKILKYLQISA